MFNEKILENRINIKFKSIEILALSLVHKSFDPISNNERLEFLGDRVLGLIISKKLLQLYPLESEGNLDRRFAFLVNKKTCLKISKNLQLEKFLVLGKTYKKKLNIEDKILGDACEALIGAIYLDSGFKSAENFVLNFWKEEIKKTITTEIDSKTKLQEYSLKNFKKLPIYKVISLKGPPHNPQYKVSVKINNSKLFYGFGGSKKIAEHLAAGKLIKRTNIK